MEQNLVLQITSTHLNHPNRAYPRLSKRKDDVARQIILYLGRSDVL